MEQRFKELFENLEETPSNRKTQMVKKMHRNRKTQMAKETKKYVEAIKKEEHSWGNERYLTFK
jgi:hypothetical protein